MNVKIKNSRASSIFFGGKFYDTDKEFDLNFSETFRLTRVAELETNYEPVAYDSSLFKEKKFFNFLGDIDLTSGFGGCSYNLLKYSVPKYDIALAGRAIGVRDQNVFHASSIPLKQEGAMVWHDQPREQWLYSPFRKNICIVPFETTVIPKSWIGKINNFDALFTLCDQNVKAFKESGVKIPIEKISWGIDPEVFYPLERPERSTFTFGTMGSLSVRKGTDVLVDAFREEFRREKDVRLICKTSANHYPFNVGDSRIEVQMGEITANEMRDDFFKKIDCFVFPTRGEGFGLPPLEAMATGVPAIVTGWSGPMEYMTSDIGWILDYAPARATAFTEQVYKEECGDWAEPSKEHLKQLMRYAYEHRDEVKEKGKIAAEYVHKHWLWKDKIKIYHDALEKHLGDGEKES